MKNSILSQINNSVSRGFMALMSVIIISITLLGVSLVTSTSGFFSQSSVLDSEYKRVSLGLAESCVNSALLKISQDYYYTLPSGGLDVPVGSNTCSITSITYGPENSATHQKVATISTKANYKGTWSNMQVSAVVQNPAYAPVIRGTLTVKTHVVNDNGGGRQPGDFTISVTPSTLNPLPSSFAGSESGTVVSLSAGSFNVSASSASGYTQSESGDCSGSIATGESKICTITIDDIPTSGTLTVVADVINDNGGSKQPSDFRLYIDGGFISSGTSQTGLAIGSHSVSADSMSGYTASSWGHHCDSSGSVSLNAGDNKTCIITFNDTPPLAPICAETVMMLDRTGSMGSGDLSDERNAANALLNLYDDLNPLPKTSVGVFGAVGSNEPYNASIIQGLTTAYSNLYNAVSSGLASSNGYTNLASAINVSQNEFDLRGSSDKSHVLILLSDGGTNRPNTPTTGDTGWKSPTATANPSEWTNPSNAFTSNNSYTTADSDDEDQGYRNFNFSVPNNATITGVEVRIEGFSTTPTNPTTVLSDSFGTGSTDSSFNEAPGWTEGGNGAEKRAAGSGVDSPSPNGDRFAVIQNDSWICESINATGVSGLNLSYFWRGDPDANQSSDDGIVEYRPSSGGTCSSGSGWTELQNHDLRNDGSWSTQSPFPLPSSLNNTTFLLRYRANSDSNEYFRIDGVLVTGTASLPNTSCQIQARVGDNNSFSSYRSVTLSSNETVLPVIGGVNDDWDNVSWSNSDFSNNNFRLETRFNDPDSSCDTSAIASLDHLEARVSYSTTNDPYGLASEAANAAKQAGTEIFTIHFGDRGSGDNDIDFLATIASNSSNDLSSNSVSGNTGFLSPAAQSADTGGDGNGFEQNAQAALTDGGGFATNANGSGDRHRFYDYPFSIPVGATITGIETRIDWWLDSTSGSNSMRVELSWDGGSTWTTAKTSSNESTSSSNAITLGSSSDRWGRTWSASDFSTDNFRVRVTSVSDNSSRDFFLDWIPVRVSYSTIPENTDDDNFFVSPNSADMQNIFETIGKKVCPALSVTPAPPPTTATLIVVTNVTNDNGGTLNADDFTSLVQANNPIPSGSPAGSFDGATSPGVAITVDPGSYSVNQATQSGYTKTLGVSCSGTLSAGETKTCTITNNDIPPTNTTTVTPPPIGNITIDSWQETP